MANILPPRNCPRCGRMVRPAAGLYRCETCGEFWPFDIAAKAQPLTPRELHDLREDQPFLHGIDGRATRVGRRFR